MRTIVAFLLSSISVLAAPALPGRGFVQEYDSVVQALATSPQQISTTYEIKGLFAINDGEGGSFHYYAGDTTATNATDCFEWGSGRLRRYYLGVTASRINVFGSSTNTAGDLNLDSYLRLGYVVPGLGAGTVAVFDANGLLTNGVASGFISAGDGITVSGSTVSTDLEGAGSVTLSTNGSGTITITGAAAASSANPTASIGLTAVNGVAATFMRSDAAPALGAVGTPGTYGDGSNFPVITTDAGGRVTSVTTNPIGATTINPTDLYIPVRDTATTFINSPLHTPSSGSTNTIVDGRLIWGPGLTNSLYREASDFVMENDDTSGFELRLRDVSGDAVFGVNGSGAPRITSSVNNQPVYLFAGNAAGGLAVTASGIQPIAATGIAIGANSSNGYWDDAYLQGTILLNGFGPGASDYSRLSITHTGTNGPIVFDSQSFGTAGPPRPFSFTNAVMYIHKNVGAILSVGDATFVDLNYGSQTNAVSGAIAIAHATNGVHGLELTHIRSFFNGSGSDQTLTIPSSWKTNALSAVPPALTNGVVTKMYVRGMGPTADAASQTNVFVSFEFF